MVKARVQLTGPATWSGRGHHFRRGESKILTQPADILFFKHAGGFSVTMLEGATPRPPPPPDSTPELEVEESDDVDVSGYTRADLDLQTKASLIQLANQDLGISLDMSMKKSDMVDAILAATPSE
jgi:hypothetical protein